MKNSVILMLVFWGGHAFSQTGLVEVQSTYAEASGEGESLKFTGRGFVVDFPVKSLKTNRTANFKLVLTAAHLVFGGIAENRLDNYEIFNSVSGEHLSSVAKISDVIHDASAVILCTKEAVDFFNEEIKVNGESIVFGKNKFGQSFSEAGACASEYKAGKFTGDIQAFAKYNGPALSFDSTAVDNPWSVPDNSLDGSQLVVNPGLQSEFLLVENKFAIPAKDQKPLALPKTDYAGMVSELSPIAITAYPNMGDVPGELIVPVALEAGYSGSPVLRMDERTQQVVITGVYKAAMPLADSEDKLGYGWVAPIEMSYGLLKVLLTRYPEKLHRWHTVPQAYLFLNKGQLVRQMNFNDFIMFEDSESSDVQTNQETAQNWLRGDVGATKWVRADTGAMDKSHPQVSKRLNRAFFQSAETFWTDSLSFLALSLGTEEFIILPPTFNSLIMTTVNDCSTCVNANIEKLGILNGSVAYFSDEEEYALVDHLWMKLNFDMSQEFDNLDPKNIEYQNTSKNSNLKTVATTFTLEEDKVKIKLAWADDQLEFFVMPTNHLLFLNPEGEWEEISYAAALEMRTDKGKKAFVETAGLIYFNTELPNPKSFRMKLEGSPTDLLAPSGENF